MTPQEIREVAEERLRNAGKIYKAYSTTRKAVETEIAEAVLAALEGRIPKRWEDTYKRMQMTPAELAIREKALLDGGGYKALWEDRLR